LSSAGAAIGAIGGTGVAATQPRGRRLLRGRRLPRRRRLLHDARLLPEQVVAGSGSLAEHLR